MYLFFYPIKADSVLVKNAQNEFKLSCLKRLVESIEENRLESWLKMAL